MTSSESSDGEDTDNDGDNGHEPTEHNTITENIIRGGAGLAFLLTAYTSWDLTGFAFLVAFLIWGDRHRKPPAGQTSRSSLWLSTLLLSILVLFARCGMLIVYRTKGSEWPSQDAASILELLGLRRLTSPLSVMQVVLSPLLVAIVSGLALYFASDNQQDHEANSESNEQASESFENSQAETSLGPTPASVLVDVALLPAAILWPTFLSLPYLLVLLVRFQTWARHQDSAPFLAVIATPLQRYIGLHVCLLYLWQILLLRAGPLVEAAAWAGVIDLHNRSSIPHLILKVALMVVLHVMYLAVGQLPTREPSEPPEPHFTVDHWHQLIRHYAEERSTAEDRSQVEEPLLSSRSQGQISHHPRAKNTAPTHFANLAFLVLSSILLQSLEGVCQIPELVACVLLGHCLLQPCIISAVVLVVGIWLLLQKLGNRRHQLLGIQPFLYFSYSAWLLCSFIAQSVAQKRPLPQVLSVIGLVSTDKASLAFALLLVQAAVTLVLATLSQSAVQQTSISRQTSRQLSEPVEDGDHLLAGDDQNDEGEFAKSSFAVLGRAPAKFLWHLGFVAVPVALFFIGATHYDVLHMIYLLLFLYYASWPTASLTPTPLNAQLLATQHWLVRVFGSLHVVAAYLLFIMKLSPLSSYLHLEAGKEVLEKLGLWRLPIHSTLPPLIGLLILVTLHAGLGEWLLSQDPVGQRNAFHPLQGNVHIEPQSHPFYITFMAKASASIGPLVVVALGYVLVLFDCKISLLGLGYLVIVACVLIWPAQRCKYQELDGAGNVRPWQDSCMPALLQNNTPDPAAWRRLEVVGSRKRRWFLLAVMCCYATLDFLVQYALPSDFLQSLFHMSPSELRFTERVVGIDVGHYGWETVVRLMRPAALLGSLRLLHFGFAVGALQAQAEEAGSTELGAESQNHNSERGLLALLRRFLILNSGKLMTVCIFAIVTQHTSAVSLLLLASVVVATCLLGGPASWKPSRRRALEALITVLSVAIVAWMVSLYAFQVEWLRQRVGTEGGPLLRLLEWVGVAVDRPKEGLEPVLRFKSILLVAIAIKQRAMRWHRYLPEDLKDRRERGRQCLLFWPPFSESNASLEITGERILSWFWQSSLVQYFSLLLQGIVLKVKSSTQKVLEAVEWSPDDSSHHHEHAESASSGFARFGGHVFMTTLRIFSTITLSIQLYLDRIWENIGFDATLAIFLVAAFLDTNILSLVFMFFLALGMAMSHQPRKSTWRHFVLPCCCLMLLWQYVVLLGWHPFSPRTEGQLGQLNHHKHHSFRRKEAILDWLGMGDVSLLGIWALFFAFSGCVLQVHKDLWEEDLVEPPAVSTLQISPPREGGVGLESGQGIERHDTDWLQWTPGAQQSSRLFNWTCFEFYQHSMDIVLVLVVALCTVETDVIHAVYLALALLMFRRRDDVRAVGNRLFVWLIVCNFAVNLAKIVYQAPLQLLFSKKWQFASTVECSFPHLLGLYKFITEESERKGLSTHGSTADIVLWAIFRMQRHVFASQNYSAVMRIVRGRQAENALERKAKHEAEVHKQADAALQYFRLRHERAQRIEKLKEGIRYTASGFAFSGALMELDQRSVQFSTEQDHILQQAIPGVRPLDNDFRGAPGNSMSAALPTQAHSEEEKDPGDSEQSEGVEELESSQDTKQHNKELSQKDKTKEEPKGWWQWCVSLLMKLQRKDRQSYMCCVLFVLLFLVDCSILALLLQLGLFTYTLVAESPSKFYWQVTLVYTEIILVAQYCYQLPIRLHCDFFSATEKYEIELFGLHTSRLRAIPIFCVYLITLMHNYSIWRQEDPMNRRTASLRGWVRSFEGSRLSRSVLSTRSSTLTNHERQGNKSSKGSLVAWFWRHLTAFREYIWRATTASERPLHFVKVTLQQTTGEEELSARQLDAEVIEASIQTILNVLRETDIRNALKQKAKDASDSRESVLSSLTEDVLKAEQAQHQAALSANTQDGVDGGGPSDNSEAPQTKSDQLPRLRNGDNAIDLSTIGPLRIKLVKVLDRKPEGSLEVLLRAYGHSPDPSLPVSQRTPHPWAMRSLQPAAHAAEALMRADATQFGIAVEPQAPSADTSPPPNHQGDSSISKIAVAEVEYHSQNEQDWYAATIAVDILAFLYVVIFYQAVVASASSLQDINDDKSVPVDFLATLLVLFGLMVLDRVFYTLGNHFGKALLLLCHMGVVYGHCLRLFWSGSTSRSAKTHIRVILLLKSLSFAFSALQLRSGYPSPASYSDGKGRHSMIFMRQVNLLGSISYQIFSAVPFLYELRALLDWSCTATTLTLFDWLKLEDINTSLFLVTVNRQLRERRRLGQRQPRYSKFFQGTLLFTGLLILLWAPLIAFSSGNGTYSVPQVVSYSVNASLVTNDQEMESLEFPVFTSGSRRSQMNWVEDAKLLPQTPTQRYTIDQAKLLCLAQDSDQIWMASYPVETSLRRMLASKNVTLEIGWEFRRNAPPPGTHSGPDCAAIEKISLARSTTDALGRLIKGKAERVELRNAARLNGTGIDDPEGSAALYDYTWQLRGSNCMINPAFSQRLGWADLAVACNASLPSSEGGQRWWNLECYLVHANSTAVNHTSLKGLQNCGTSYNGPRVVAILERVQAGLIGETLSSIGIIGLYITVVLAIGRFLRFSTKNMRMRIQYEDLPNTKQLVTICQDIYIARAEQELALEEELYWGLVNIFRLPAMLFEMTKKKKSV